jgi:GxxExxY protein
VPKPLLHGHLTGTVINAFYRVYDELGPGFLESVYQRAMVVVLRELGLTAQTETPIPVNFHGELIGQFRADLLVEHAVIVELKTAAAIDSSHEAQLINYLHATPVEVGLILNFGDRPSFKRVLLNNRLKRSRRP